MNTFTSLKGEMEVSSDILESEVDFWRTYQADYCYFDPLLGAVARGEIGSWYKVKENHDGDIMILVEIKERDSGEITLGWLDCRVITIIQPSSRVKLSELDETCFDLNPDS